MPFWAGAGGPACWTGRPEPVERRHGHGGLPHVYELQRPKSPADVELIAQQLRPYLDGRDWVSINRGEIVDIDRLAGRS